MLGKALGPYRIDSQLGSGGMGTVYAATVSGRVPGIDAGTRVALKVVHPHLLETPGFFRRFMREADLGASIQHRNVVRTYLADALSVDGRQHNFLVMEYVEGQNLRELIAELGRVPEELCRHIGGEVANALACIHDAGVVHRDIKPENVLITPGHDVKVMDLGVARLTEEAIRLSQSGAFVGSLHYAAPEQFTKGGSGVDQRADLHALGLVLYELACARHPFGHDEMQRVIHAVVNDAPRRVAAINPQLSAYFEEVVHKLLAKDPDARFQTAAELAGVLAEGEESAWWKEHSKALREATKRPLRRIHIPRETALYGRDKDLARLRALFAKAKDGDGQVVLVEGEAGVGKTRLVDEFVGLLRQEDEDLNFLFASYPPGGAATAAGAFSTAYREQFGSAGLTQTLETYLASTPVLIPAFAALLRGEPAPTGQEPLTKDSLQTVFVHATHALAAERPTIVLIDDLHFAPADGRALFAALALALPGHRALLVGTSRPGVLPEDWVAQLERNRHSSRVTLERLFPKDLVSLLEDTLRSARLAEELGGRIALKSDGNPFFVFEILQGLREGQFITQNDGGMWETSRVIGEIEIPSSVLELVNARVADLDDEQRDLLEVAACCGFEFDPLLLASVLEVGPIPAMRRLARIERTHRLVRSAGRRYVFDHHQVQEALYDGMPVLLREAYHASLAERLEALESAAEVDPGAIEGALAVDLCEHFFKGARGEPGLRYLDRALDHLGSGYLNDSAIALADRALTVSGLVTGRRRVDLLLRKAARHGHLGQSHARREALKEAQSVERDDAEASPSGKVEYALGLHLSDVARYDEALALFADAQARAEADGNTVLLAEATNARGAALYRSGRTDEAREHHERAIDLFTECASRKGLATAHGNLGILLLQVGDVDQARRHMESQLEITRAEGNRRGEATATGNLGGVFWALGRTDESRAHFERSFGIAREIGFRTGEMLATGNLGNIFQIEGRLENSYECFARATEIAGETGDLQKQALVMVSLGFVRSLQGDDAAARGHLEACLSIARDIGARREIAWATLTLGNHDARWNAPDAAREHLAEAESIAREIGEAEVLGSSLLALSRLARDRGDIAAAKTYATDAINAERGAPSPYRLAHLAALPGEDPAAAVAAFPEHEASMAMEPAMVTRFLLFQATGDSAHLADAHRRLMFLREHAGADHQTTILENVPLHRDIVAAWDARDEAP